MRYFAALAGLALAAYSAVSVITGYQAFSVKAHEAGQAFVTQAKTLTGSQTEAYFGDNWGSVRLFPLMSRPVSPLKVYIETHPKNGLYQAHYRDYVLWSLASWNQALGGRLVYAVTNSRKNADITVDWVPGFSDKYVAGVTSYEIGHADIEIKAMNIPDKDIKANIIHEFGHALGIAGHSSNPNDIMVGSRRWHRGTTSYEPQLSQGDVQAIRRLYSSTWSRGEDLYSVVAQRASLPSAGDSSIAINPLAGSIVNTAANTVINMQPLEDQLQGSK